MLSIVVNFFNNRREAANTLYSLTRSYQRNVGNIDYEVIALDHGSDLPLSEEEVRAFGPQFRYRYVETRDKSPVRAINAACGTANGDRLMVMIDGAHLLSPGILRATCDAFAQSPSPFVATVPFHLGPEQQNKSVLAGYNQQREDELLARCGWKTNGYKLFSIAGSFADASLGWFGCLFESGCFALRKTDFASLGGFDERFVAPGGGLVNLDFFQRAVAREDLDYVMLLGEGSFHQFHGGVASNAPADRRPWDEFHAEYRRVRGADFRRVPRRPRFVGRLPDEALGAARISANLGLELWEKARGA